jgi:hypothetical protein
VDILLTIMLVAVSSFSLHAFVMFASGINLKINPTFISGFVFISLFRGALSLLCGYIFALGLNQLYETNEFESPWTLFLLSLPLLLVTAVYSYFSYRRSMTWMKRKLEQYKKDNPPAEPAAVDDTRKV